MTSGLKDGEEFPISVVMQDLDLDENSITRNTQISFHLHVNAVVSVVMRRQVLVIQKIQRNSSHWSSTLTGSYAMHTGFVQW